METKKDPEIFLKHILESIKEIEKYSKNIALEKFLKTTEKQDAIIRRLEVIGEAIKNVPPSYKDKYPSIAWKKVAGLRDVLIHEYFGVDLDMTWEIIKKDIPILKKQIKELL